MTRRIVYGSARGLQDVSSLLQRLGAFTAPAPELVDFLRLGRDVVVTRAPYSAALFGGPAVEHGAAWVHWPLRDGVLVALQRTPERQLRVLCHRDGRDDLALGFELPIHYLEVARRPVPYAVARDYFHRYDDRLWAAGIAGLFIGLMHARDIRFREGARLLVNAALPGGRWLGQSASMQAAVLRAIMSEANLALPSADMVHLCQHVARELAISVEDTADLDTALSAEAHHVVRAHDAKPSTAIALPEELTCAVLMIPGRRLDDEARGQEARAAAAMAYRILASVRGLVTHGLSQAVVRVEDPVWEGRLARVGVEEYEADYARQLPSTLGGRDFLDSYGGPCRTGVAIDPSREYAVRAAAAYVVYEEARAAEFCGQLPLEPSEERFVYLGSLLTSSHDSADACGLVSDTARELVSRIRRLGPERGLYGATSTARDGHLAMVVLMRQEAGAAIAELAKDAQREVEGQIRVLEGTSPGAVRFGHLRLRGY